MRRKALRVFRQRGVVVHVGAIDVLFSAYETLENMEFSEFLENVFNILASEGASMNGILTKDLAESIGSRLQKDADRQVGMAAASIEVINTFTVPSWQSDTGPSTSGFGTRNRISAPPKPVIDGRPQSKAGMFRSRYELLLAKTLRNPQFRPPASGMLSMAKSSPYYQLTGIESLAGSKDEKLVLGMLTQLEEGSWFLEDLNGSVKLDLSQASVTPGLHTECSFAIAQGHLIETLNQESIFHVSAMGTPPLEKREESLNAMSKNPNLFGGHFEASETAQLLKLEKEAVDTMFILLSDVALDNSRVMAGLKHMFTGYIEDGALPKLVILMGNFLSHPFGQHVDDVMTLTEKFTELGTAIAADFSPLLEECVFVVVPGMNDPGPGNVLPRPPMPKTVMKGFIDAVGSERVHLATNPCRLRYMTQEIVILRDDLMQKMIRHCSVKPEFGESGSMSEHFVKSVVDQSHLCPLPNSARPVLWRHAHALWLFPVPHVVVLADKTDGYICKYGGTLGLNPGSFATDFSFQVYLPAQKRAQQSSVNSEEILDETENALHQSDQECASDRGDSDNDASGDDNTTEEVDMHIGGIAVDTDGDGLPLPGQPLDEDEAGGSDAMLDDIPAGAEDGGEDEGKHLSDDDVGASESESDDDSVLIPLDALPKRDIKAMLRQAVASDDSGEPKKDASSSGED